MKPLTIEQLKALPVGEWVWVATVDGKYGAYGRVCQKFDDDNFRVETIESYLVDPYETYGTKWLAYKNKEQAEAKGEIVELPCIAMIEQGLVDGKMKQTQEAQGFNGRYSVVYMDKTKCKIPLIDVCWSKEGKCRYIEAERRLAELKGEKL